MNPAPITAVLIFRIPDNVAQRPRTCAVAKALGRVLEITLIESDEIGVVGVGEATVPTLRQYNYIVDIDEPDFLRAVQGTYKLGIAFENWREPGSRYFHAFGSHGQDHWAASFQHYWLRARELGIAHDFDDYSFEAVAAFAHRFAHAKEGELNYAFHIDASLFARYLRKIAEAEGARRIEGKVVETRLNGESGFIESVTLEDGKVIEGDLFVDCSGFRGLLVEKALQIAYEDWSHWLPCDRAVANQTESVGPPLPYTRAIAHGCGWQWRIPLQHRMGNGFIFSSRHLSDDEARALLLADLEGKVLTELGVIRFQPGARRSFWSRNCVAIGLSGGFIEPLESTSIHLIQQSIMRLIRLFPHDGFNDSGMAEYNEQMRFQYEHIRDFIILHYHVTNRTDTAFWRHCRAMEIPETLAHRIALFSEGARACPALGEYFGEPSWVQVMLGQGIEPRAYHPIVGMTSEAELNETLTHIRNRIADAVSSLPLHQDYIAGYGRADVNDAVRTSRQTGGNLRSSPLIR